jgi:hypothetical protein
MKKGLEPRGAVFIVRTPIDSGGGNKPGIEVLFEDQFATKPAKRGVKNLKNLPQSC